jgi:hypothetical protein
MGITQFNITQNKTTQKSITQYRSSRISITEALPRPKMWLDAASVVKDGSNLVSEWTDKSGNLYSPVQTTAINKPTWVDGVLNGLPVLRFSSSHNLKFQYPSVIPQPVTIFAVWYAVSNQLACYCNFSTSFFDLQVFNNQVQIYAGAPIGYNKSLPFSFILNTSIYDGASSYIYENGILKANGNASLGIMNGITVGALYNNGWGLIGDIAEIIMYDRTLQYVERIQVEHYLMTKYDL